MHAFFPPALLPRFVFLLLRGSKKERAHTSSTGCSTGASLKARHKTRWMKGAMCAGTCFARRSPLNALSMADGPYFIRHHTHFCVVPEFPSSIQYIPLFQKK